MADKNKHELLKAAVPVEHRWPQNMMAEDKNDFQAQAAYDTFESFLKMVGNAWVSPDSVIYKNGIVMADSLASQEHQSYYRLKHLAKKIITSKKIRLSANKKYLLVTDLWSAGHFHWFVDVLPKLLCIENRTKEFTLLLPDSAYTRSIGLESLQLLQWQFEDIIWMKENEFYKTGNLYYISKISRSGQMYPELMKTMRQKFIGNREPATKKIYISRGKAPFRKVVNEDELVREVTAYGFEILYGEEFTLADQVSIFSSCKTLLGIHGAGLTSCIFMPPCSTVIELRKKENGPFNVGYWHLADSLDHKYFYYNGIPDSDKPLVGNGCNLTITLDDFEEKILKKLD